MFWYSNQAGLFTFKLFIFLFNSNILLISAAKPKFVEPVQFTLSDQGDVKMSVKLQKFYPQEMEVGWFFKREQSEEKMSSEVIKSNSGDKFDLESKCSVSGELLKDPSFKVIVRWKHQSMEKPQSREMSIRGKDLDYTFTTDFFSILLSML